MVARFQELNLQYSRYFNFVQLVMESLVNSEPLILGGVGNPEHMSKAIIMLQKFVDDCEKNHSFVSAIDLQFMNYFIAMGYYKLSLFFATPILKLFEVVAKKLTQPNKEIKF